MKTLRALAAAALAGGGILVSAPAASAAPPDGFDNLYPTGNYQPRCGKNTFCLTDNSAVSVFMERSISRNGKSRIREILNREYQPTDLKIVYERKANHTGSNETDIVYQKGRVGGGAMAVTWCDDAKSAYMCDQYHVRFNTDTPFLTAICHETGHAVGLTHGHEAKPRKRNDDSRLGCMKTPIDFNATRLGAHNRKTIDAHY
ncbi:hypothetical protein [Actinomadura kijaniata]|uniref:hypothetical protein n=1 Tax=Actinomadura kijaniata TaxID=46161 RepID=UPI000A04AD9C|nr:hypothetical protein [Actinomadura kijaniata]